jgi:SAM-dependent methyltransferase
MSHHYTFGDSDQAGARLRRLAELYEPETRELLKRGGKQAPTLAVDLGCGPGHSTRLLHDTLRPRRTVGLDSSERYVTQALRAHGPELEFFVHDVTSRAFPVGAPDLLLCRFLLTHLRDPARTLETWASLARPGAHLLVHETEALESSHPALSRYYELVGALQRRYGQRLHIGAHLEDSFAHTAWRLVESRANPLEKSAPAMAELHLANLKTWRQDDYARGAFDLLELDRLEASLARIASGEEAAGSVRNVARQIVAVRGAGRAGP